MASFQSFQSSTASLAMMESPIMARGSADYKYDTTNSSSARPNASRQPNRQQKCPQNQQNQQMRANTNANRRKQSISWSDGDSNANNHDDDFDEDELTLTDMEPDFFYAPLFSPQAAVRQQKFRVLGTTGLIGLTYFVSCGGPVGSEPLASAGGPLIGFLGLVVYLVFCLLPFACVLAELGSAFPDNGGFTVWVVAAFGPFWGFQVGYWSWVSATLNNAIYPGLMYSIICDTYGTQARSKATEYALKVAMACLLAVPSLLSVRLVAVGSFVLLIVVLTLSAVFSTWAFIDGDHAWARLLEIRSEETTSIGVGSNSGSGSARDYGDGIDWVLLMNTLYWNFDGLYNASVIGGEVRNPARTIPRVLAITVTLTVATYVFPLAAAVVASRMPWILFDEDAYPEIAKQIGGSFLHGIMLACSLLSCIGLFACSLFFQSFQILGMAEVRLLPSTLRYRHKTLETPQYAVLVSLLATSLLLAVDFESILGMANALSAGIQVLIVLAMLQLRRKLPYITRPTKIPGDFALLCTLLVPTTGVFLYILVTTLFEPKTALVLFLLVAPGVAYGVLQRRHVRLELQERARRQQQQLQVLQPTGGALEPVGSTPTVSTQELRVASTPHTRLYVDEEP